MKSLNQLRLSPSTNFQALSDKARLAAAISVVERGLDKPRQAVQRKRAKKGEHLTPIQQSARTILAHVEAHAAEDTTLINETPGRFSSAHAIISLYNDADIEAQRIAKERRKTDPTVKVPKLVPVIRYVLYPSILEPTKLGSVAIYCENVRLLNVTIAKAGSLFGIPVKRTTIESGVSQYIDVVIRA